LIEEGVNVRFRSHTLPGKGNILWCGRAVAGERSGHPRAIVFGHQVRLGRVGQPVGRHDNRAVVSRRVRGAPEVGPQEVARDLDAFCVILGAELSVVIAVPVGRESGGEGRVSAFCVFFLFWLRICTGGRRGG